MVLIRSAEKKDFSAVLSIAKELDSYNLPYDRKVIRDLIRTSELSFRGKLPRSKAKYLFVMEDEKSKKIFGTSLIVAQQGTPRSPHIYYERRGGVLWFDSTTRGPTEIGGLFLKKGYRNRKEKFGKQLSWVRFLYMALHPERFGRRILAEFLPPFEKGRENLFWNFLGKRFTGLSYREADRLSVYTKKFVFDLLPKKILVRYLPKETQALLGKVGKEAIPACRMLQKIGFRKTNRIEPFDGGPYYEAKREEIAVIRRAKRLRERKAILQRGKETLFLVEKAGKVRAHVGKVLRLKEREKGVYLPWNSPPFIPKSSFQSPLDKVINI